MVIGKKNQNDNRHLLASIDEMNNGKIHQAENAAFMHVRENIKDLGKVADDTDLLFLKGLLDSPVVNSLVRLQERLEEPPKAIEPIYPEICDVAEEISYVFETSLNYEARELSRILKKSHVKALLETHDAVVEVRKAPPASVTSLGIPSSSASSESSHKSTMPSSERTETVRVVGLRRQPKEPLGLTVQVDDRGNLIIARILGGSTVSRQGLLRPGEVIMEVNNKPVHTADELQHAIQAAKENLSLKVAPGISSDNNKPIKSTCYMRALFDYDPSEDTLLPCREIGLPFNRGDILQIVDQADPNWWQARRVEGEGLGAPGLIPSLELEERRKAFVPPEADFVHKIGICGTRVSRKKKRKMYESKSNGEFDSAELLLYEEVARMPPFRRKTLALVGPRGVGRRTLKNRLINSDPEKFGTIVPYTSRPPRVLEENGKSYWFTDRESMENDIKQHRYLEFGEYGNHLYGTKLDSVRELIRAGKMCVLDCSPGALKTLHNSTEFMPYVIFIAAPGMEQLKTLYDHGRSTGASSRNLTFDRQSSIRYSSRRARTLESLASLYEEDDLRSTLEESAALQRAYEKYIDLVIVNEDFDNTFRQVVGALDALATEHQWVPVNWIY
ncbi:MAGUK p55 subfamily member 2 isoform X1 [Microplitis mediator]|uniref:MAGUK p55 subfamily member 2 isoform X1 n=1 Tax=Microplitis mediator TaxID=375433 RepID=UPI002555C73E|nr:MAGUK p55 subfamily member 2 isoform X1 [Microplitis mediator]